MTEEAKQTEETAAAVETPADNNAPLKGIVGTKIGMTRVFTSESRMVPVTVIASEGVIVTQVKTKQTDGYDAVQVGFGDVVVKNVNKAKTGHFAKKNLTPKRWLHEFRVKDPAPFKVGQTVPASLFVKGEWLQVSG